MHFSAIVCVWNGRCAMTEEINENLFLFDREDCFIKSRAACHDASSWEPEKVEMQLFFEV